MAKIIGNTTATPYPRPDWNQTDEAKADYIKNKPAILTEDEIKLFINEAIAKLRLISTNDGNGNITLNVV